MDEKLCRKLLEIIEPAIDGAWFMSKNHTDPFLFFESDLQRELRNSHQALSQVLYEIELHQMGATTKIERDELEFYIPEMIRQEYFFRMNVDIEVTNEGNQRGPFGQKQKNITRNAMSSLVHDTTDIKVNYPPNKYPGYMNEALKYYMTNYGKDMAPSDQWIKSGGAGSYLGFLTRVKISGDPDSMFYKYNRDYEKYMNKMKIMRKIRRNNLGIKDYFDEVAYTIKFGWDNFIYWLKYKDLNRY